MGAIAHCSMRGPLRIIWTLAPHQLPAAVAISLGALNVVLLQQYRLWRCLGPLVIAPRDWANCSLAPDAAEPIPELKLRYPVQIIERRSAQVGPLPVRHSLPNRRHRIVGAWCFADLMGPHTVSADEPIDIAPHLRQGLQTVTWLFSGEFLHRDSLSSEQLIRPGQLNLMIAVFGVAHSEKHPNLTYGQMHDIQLWWRNPPLLAMPTRHSNII